MADVPHPNARKESSPPVQVASDSYRGSQAVLRGMNEVLPIAGCGLALLSADGR
jgi:hypothetical protein